MNGSRKRTGQTVIIENRPGAGGNTALQHIAKSDPDGHTLLVATNGAITISPALFKNRPVDSAKDVAPVAMLANVPQLLTINGNIPARNAQELITLAKARPGTINYGSAGPGSTPHLTVALFGKLAGIDIVHVPYRGLGPALTDLVAGNIQALSIGYGSIASFVQSGQLRIIGVAGPERRSYLPRPSISRLTSPSLHHRFDPTRIWSVIGASAVGTMIEWYDFYIFGSLATIISPLFYPPGNDTLALIAYLSTFAVGFVVRPFGALFFGRIGDLVGRKYAFVVTLVMMGGATALVGFLPTYATSASLAPIALLAIRIAQGLALGGEYGGAAVYVAEHVPDDRRGFYTSFIQITATLGLFVSLVVDPRGAERDVRSGVPRLGLAHSVPDLDRAGRDLALHPAADAGVADLPAHQERRA